MRLVDYDSDDDTNPLGTTPAITASQGAPGGKFFALPADLQKG